MLILLPLNVKSHPETWIVCGPKIHYEGFANQDKQASIHEALRAETSISMFSKDGLCPWNMGEGTSVIHER